MAIVVQLESGERINVESQSAVIGRDSKCDIALPEESRLQPRHAQIKYIAGRWLIQSDGAWTVQVGDGGPGTKFWLKANDEIRLSESGPRLVFMPSGVSPSPVTSHLADDHWFLDTSGQQYGPFPFTQLAVMSRQQRFGPNDLVRRGDQASWTRASQVPGLLPVSSDAATSVKLPPRNPNDPPVVFSGLQPTPDESVPTRDTTHPGSPAHRSGVLWAVGLVSTLMLAGFFVTKPRSPAPSQTSQYDPIALQRTATLIYMDTMIAAAQHLAAEVKEKQMPIAEQYSRRSKLLLSLDSRNVDPMLVKASVRLGRAYAEAESVINRIPETAISAIFESLANGNPIGVLNDQLIVVKKVDDEINSARLDWVATISLMGNKYGSN